MYGHILGHMERQKSRFRKCISGVAFLTFLRLKTSSHSFNALIKSD